VLGCKPAACLLLTSEQCENEAKQLRAARAFFAARTGNMGREHVESDRIRTCGDSETPAP
jgi:hypothetical protein